MQLALVVDRDVDYVSGDVDSSPTYTFYLLFSSVFFFILFTTWQYIQARGIAAL